MLVSAAMAERPRATASGKSQPAPAARAPAAQTRAARQSTARVATTQGVRRSELPGWFWGALGCLTVLVVGLTIVFVMGQPGGASAPSGDIVPAVIPTSPTQPAQAAAAPGAAARAPEAQPARAGGIRVEPMAAPRPAIDQAAGSGARGREAQGSRPADQGGAIACRRQDEAGRRGEVRRRGRRGRGRAEGQAARRRSRSRRRDRREVARRRRRSGAALGGVGAALWR